VIAGSLRKRPRADELLHAKTRDGWRIALHHWLPRGDGKRDPILLCHGLASTASTFDLGVGPGLAPWLASRGHRVFALELRGAGDSERPRLGGKRSFTWGVHEYLTQDIPAAIERVCATTGSERLHWVGHSMGGVLLMGFAAGELGRRLRSATIVGSAIDYKHGSDFGRVKSLIGLLRLLHVAPLGSAARAYARFAGDRFLDEFMFAPESLTPEERRTVWASAFTWVPGQVLRELATTFERESFRGRDGVRWRHGLPRFSVPLLVLAGSRDRQCTVAQARATFEAIGSPEKKFRVYEGLGHIDLLVGARSEREVYPEIAAWIESPRS